jgi:nitric oxide reductase NorD protein
MTNTAGEQREPTLPAWLSRLVRALWGFDVRVHALPMAANDFTARRPRFAGSDLWLPSSPLVGVPGSFDDYLFAACAHVSAHLRFGAPRFEIRSLKPAQVAITSVLEDARVERLAIEHYPGLATLWAPYHQARADSAKTSSSLLARLARALHDDTSLDDDAWVSKGRQLFMDGRAEWHDANLCRRIGSTLGNDLGQMRVQFDANGYAVQPPYRDDNTGLWHFDQELGEDGSQLELEGVRRIESDVPAVKQREQGEPEERPARCSGESEPAPGISLALGADVTIASKHPEWDYVIQRERPAFCSVFERPVEPGHTARLVSEARDAATQKRLQRSASRLSDRRAVRTRRLLDGDRLDLPAALGAVVSCHGGVIPDPRIYSRVRYTLDPPALLLLLDLSESLNDVPRDASSSCLHLAQRAIALLAISLSTTTRDWAIHGFSSNGRHDIGYRRFKDFDDPYDEHARSRLAGMRAHSSTRLGTALRHAGRALALRRARRKVLLVMTDGEPSDIDVHDSEYLLFDAKQATIQNRRRGVLSYCLGLDAQAEMSVARIFGAGNYSLLREMECLPQRLTEVYMRLSA